LVICTNHAHGGDLPGCGTRDGVTPDGRRAGVVTVTGDVNTPDLRAVRSTNDLVDREPCTSAKD
jgi:D-alanyl-D-alanine carboxypeptidase